MIQWFITSSLLILVVLLLRAVTRQWLSARARYALWLIVLIRLLVPFTFGTSPISVMNWVDEVTPQSVKTLDDAYTLPNLTDPDDTTQMIESFESFEMPEMAPEVIPPENQTDDTITWAELSTVLGILWFAGFAMSGAILLSCNLRLSGALKRSRKPVPVECGLPVYETAVVETPCMFGYPKPAIYILPELKDQPLALRHVLFHELTHCRHLDHIWSFLRCLCLILHWYNPLVWVAAYLSREDGELACDEGALARLRDTERAAYGETLIALTCTGHSGLMTMATTMTGSKKSLLERVKRIAEHKKHSVMALLVVLVLLAAAAVSIFTGHKADTGINGVWRADMTVLGTDVPAGTRGWMEYEFKNGVGRRIHYADGEVFAASPLTYTIRDDRLVVSETDEYGEILVTVEYTWTRSDGTLTLLSHRGEQTFEQVERRYPAYFPVEGYLDVLEVLQAGEPTLKADLSETEKTQLLQLLEQGQASKAPNGAVESQARYYLNLRDGRQQVRSLYLTDGVIGNGERENYALSNMDEVVAFLEGLTWREPQYPADPRQAIDMTPLDGVLLLRLSHSDKGQWQELAYYNEVERANNAESFYNYALRTGRWTETEAPEDVKTTAPWEMTLTGEYWSMTAYAGCDLVRFETAADGFAEHWYDPGDDGFGYTLPVYDILRQWYDELEYARMYDALLPLPDQGQTEQEAAQALIDARDVLYLQTTSGSKNRFAYVKSTVVDGDFVRRQTEDMRERGEITENQTCIYAETVFVPGNDRALSWHMAGNTTEYTGDAPDGALTRSTCYILTNADGHWTLSTGGTSW